MPPLESVAALLCIDVYDPADADDLAVLRDLLARREAVVAAAVAGAPRPAPPSPPGLRIVRDPESC